MKIKDRPEYRAKNKPVAMRKNDKVVDAVSIMSKNNYGSIIVTNDNNEVEGIVTERDLMIRLLHEKKDPNTTTMADIMTREVKVAREDDDIIDWLRIMSNERFRHLPIVDQDNKLVSMMSQGDFVSYTWPSLISTLTDKAKESISLGYQIPLIILALAAYAWIVSFFS